MVDELHDNKLVPDYDTPCQNCGQTPTVKIITQHGATEVHLEMCGPCTWGEAACIDPANW